MTQSRKQSALEVGVGTFTGFVGSYIICWVTFYNVRDVTAAAFISTLACTVWSIVRGYTLRRYFNNKASR